jgi:hypothetical protein
MTAAARSMNRRARRRAAALNRKRHDTIFHKYVRHLPEIPVDAPYERGRVYHTVFFHDHDCPFYASNNLADCACNVIVRRFVEPRRS